MTAEKSNSPKTVPVRELIATQADRLGIRNGDLAAAIGYQGKSNIISMLTSGAMRLPLNKITVTAKALHIDPYYLALCVDAENSFGLAPLLESLVQRTPITLNEERLILRLRKEAGGMDIDMDEHPKEAAEFLGAYAKMVKRDLDAHKGDVTRLKVAHPRSALSKEDRKRAAS